MLAEQLHVPVLPHDRRLELIQFLNKIMYPLFYTPRSRIIPLETDIITRYLSFSTILILFVFEYLLSSNSMNFIFPHLLEIDAPLRI